MNERPFLTWAGGKYRIVETILQELPRGTRFVAPFAGSCAVYRNTDFPRALICNVNRDLISLYRHLPWEGEDVIRRNGVKRAATPELLAVYG